MRNRLISAVALTAMLAGCGGDGGTTTDAAGIGSVASAPTPTPSGGCSLRERQDWTAAQLREWYLFPETLPTRLDPVGYTTVSDYIDALTATARSQRKDRYFTYLTSIRDEDAYYDSGASAGYGIRVSLDAPDQRVFVSEAFEGAPALAAGIDRGTEILAIGQTSATLRSVSDIMSAGGQGGVTEALGPATAGTTRVLRIDDAAGTREVSVTKTNYELVPISPRYGAKIITEEGRSYGYVNLRTFISTADPALRHAFERFKAAGVTKIVVDLRYNGGGLISIAQLAGDLMGANRMASEVFNYTSFRSEKAFRDSTRFFGPQPEAVAPVRLAFIGTGGTASASELLINAFTPYLHADSGLIGTNTYGKPVGQIALDKPACDDRLRVIAFATQNADRAGDYYNGLAGKVAASCQAVDDLQHPLGNPQERSTRAALDFLEGKSCNSITVGDVYAQTLGQGKRVLLSPAQPSTAQREVPGLF